MVVGELLVAMRNAELVQPPHEPAGPVEQIELVFLAAVDVERLPPTEIVRLGFDRNDRVLPQPIRPARSRSHAIPRDPAAGHIRHLRDYRGTLGELAAARSRRCDRNPGGQSPPPEGA